MARDHGRVMASIWDDPDFIGLSATAQRHYLFLVSQSDLAHTGVIPLRWTRWTRAQAGMTVRQLRADTEALANARFVVLDEDTEELLVRTLIRNDGIYKQPNVMRAVVKAADAIASPILRDALADELARLPLDELSDAPTKTGGRSQREVVAGCVEDLLRTLRRPVPGRVSRTLPGTPRDGYGEGSGVGVGEVLQVQDGLNTGSSSRPRSLRDSDADDDRPDVDALCQHLAERIEANGSKRPTITKRWRTSARLLLDVDGRTPDQVRAAIDWCQTDEFWRANVMSMPKLREKYDQLRLAATRNRPGRDRVSDILRGEYAWAEQAEREHAASRPAIGGAS